MDNALKIPLIIVVSGIFLIGLLLIFVGYQEKPTVNFGNTDAFVSEESFEEEFEHKERIPTITAKEMLSSVYTWLYYLDTDLDTVKRIVDSDYDMVVIEPGFTEKDNKEYNLLPVIKDIKNSSGSHGHSKIVLAYLSIGEAEDYRYYWEDNWKPGSPSFVLGENKEWEGNYPVAYWREQWKNILMKDSAERRSMIKRLIEAGFDGVYLDTIEVYEDENVLDKAQRDGVNAKNEMVKLVNEIKEYSRKLDPNFIIVGQNALELLYKDDYYNSVDAVSQEHIWMTGTDEVQGDCPLPEDEEEADTKEYEESLKAPCRRYYLNDWEGTLHTSSEYYLDIIHDITVTEKRPLMVFTVDYALDFNNINLLYARSRNRGFTPFVTNYDLDTFKNPR